MKKIFIYVGSGKGESSNTYNYINSIMTNVKNLYSKQINIKIFHPKNIKIKRCIGCGNCFDTGICTLEKQDDMEMIKREMLSSDIIILGSPIYGANVSGDMKIFLDRISSWYHLMPLRGKSSMFIFTSCGNGVHFAKEYVNFIMVFLGLNIISTYNVPVFYPQQLDESSMIKDSAEKAAKTIIKYLQNNKNCESNDKLEKAYSHSKNYIKLLEKLNTYEYRYWEKNKMLQFETFSDLLKYEKGNSI